jgi:transposase
MNDIDPQAWMADVLARRPNITASRVHEMLPWHWKPEVEAIKTA